MCENKPFIPGVRQARSGLPIFWRTILKSSLLMRLATQLVSLIGGLLIAGTAFAASPIFVLNSLNADVSVIDPVTFKEVKRIPVGKEPHHLYLTPDGKSVMVANATSNSITLIDPKTAEVQKTIPNIADPYHLRFSPDMKWFVTAANRLNHVDIYRWERKGADIELKLVKRIATGKTPSHINIDTKSKMAYISVQDSDELMAIDLPTQTVKWVIPTGKTPADVYLTPDDKHLLVGLTGENGVQVFDVTGDKGKLVKTILTNPGAHAFRSQGDGKHVFVSDRGSNKISRIDYTTMKVVDTYKTLAGPDCMEMLNDGKTLLVTTRWAGKLVAIDINTKEMVRKVNVGKSPHGVWSLDHANRQ